MRDLTVEVNGLTKIYGKQLALDNVSFKLQKGEIVGFLGPNGAGKSTTLKILTTFLLPDHGQASVYGYDIIKEPGQVRRSIGYLPEQNPLYFDMYVEEYLRFIGGLHGMSGNLLAHATSRVVEQCGLIPERNKKVGQMSKGYKQRVGLAQSLLHDPPLLILDEPTTGLDPNQIIEIRELIKSMSKEKTVLFSTHIMQEVQAICDRSLVINKGKLVADASLDELLKVKKSTISLRITFSSETNPNVFEPLMQQGLIEKISLLDKGTKFQLICATEKDPRQHLMSMIAEQGLILRSMEEVTETKSMEDVFRELTKEEK